MNVDNFDLDALMVAVKQNGLALQYTDASLTEDRSQTPDNCNGQAQQLHETHSQDGAKGGGIDHIRD